jgi:hypothetical protein
LVDKERIDRHLIIRKTKEETSIISEESSEMLDEEVIFRALGFSFFELLNKKNIIFEGWNDKYTFQTWVKSSKADKETKAFFKDIGLLHAFGAKDIQRVAGILEDFSREYIIISDADKTSKEYQTSFDSSGVWKTHEDLGFTTKQTIEDFIDEDYIDKILSSILKKEHLSSEVTIPSGCIFNDKIAETLASLDLNKLEKNRLKRNVKNAIYDKISVKNYDLTPLVDAIKKELKNIWWAGNEMGTKMAETKE